MPKAEPKTPSSPRGFDAERLNSLVQTLAIIGAGAWGVYTFIYEARIQPSLEPPAVSVSTRLEKAGERDNRIAIRSTVTRKNVGQTGVRVLGLVYNVIGVRAQFNDSPTEITGGERGRADRVAVARDYTFDEPGTVILHQGTLFAGAGDDDAEPSNLNPGEAVSRDLIVYADRTRYDLVRFEVGLAYTKDGDLPVRLRLEANAKGVLTLSPTADCRTEAARCERLKMTDFGTEFSLW